MNTRRLYLALALVLLAAIGGGAAAVIVFGSNTPDYEGPRNVVLPREANLAQTVDSLKARGILKRPVTFRWMAEATGWGAQIKPGHYAFDAGASNYDLLSTLRRGLQTPVRLTIPPGSRPPVVAAVMAKRMEFNAADVRTAWRDSALAARLDADPAHLFGYMLPETYEFYWHTPVDEVVARIKRSFDRFYETELAAGAGEVNLTKGEVLTLASIVEREALLNKEKPRIAGVYLNRLADGWKLQADPTVIYAVVDRGGERPRRVLYKHLELDHPYNTYVYRGLPPGPITNPDKASLRAVAEAEEHGYYYFAADGSGGHAFARTARGHARNAARYHRWLDEQQRIKRERQQASQEK